MEGKKICRNHPKLGACNHFLSGSQEDRVENSELNMHKLILLGGFEGGR